MIFYLKHKIKISLYMNLYTSKYSSSIIFTFFAIIGASLMQWVTNINNSKTSLISSNKSTFTFSKKEASQSKRESVTMTFKSVRLVYNNSVGNEWSTWIEVDSTDYNRGESVNINVGSTIKLHAFEDDKYSDHNSVQITITISDLNQEYISERVVVREGHGRFAGNTAEWEFSLDLD